MASGMVHWVRAAAVAAAVFMFSATESDAADAVFVVQRVPVAADGPSATAAKDAAQMQGRRRAMDLLLRRLTIESDWPYLPRLAAGQPASAVAAGDRTPIAISDSGLQNLEGGFEVYDEKSSASTYRAIITYRFKPDAVRRLLRSAAIPFSETQTLPALVLPVLETSQGLYLWESNNPWMAAWRGRSFLNELTPIRAPSGAAADVGKTTARQALSLDPAAMEALAKQYDVAQVIVAHARLDKSGGDDRLSVRLLNAYRDTAAASVTPETEDDSGVENIALAAAAMAGESAQTAAKVGDVLASGVYTEPSGRFGALAAKSIDSVVSRYGASWKAKTLIDYSKEVALETTAFFQSVDDWARIRAGLNATPLVGGIQVFALSPRGAELRLKVYGDPSRLTVALDAYGVVFWSEDGARWLLATPSQAARLKGDKSLRLRRVDFDPASAAAGEAATASEYSNPELAPDSKIERTDDPQ